MFQHLVNSGFGCDIPSFPYKLPEAGAAVETRIVDHAPAQAILETADAIADLIVMGTHGRTGWRRALVGSVAEKVVHHTTAPSSASLRARPRPSERSSAPSTSPRSRASPLEEACALAATFDAELLMVHVTDPGDEASYIEGEFAAWIDPYVRTAAATPTWSPPGMPPRRPSASPTRRTPT